MFNWKIISIILCNYGFWKEVRPLVPFLTPYLVSPPKNFTDVDLYSKVYPFWTYSYLLMLIPVFILTDLLRYKPIIISETLANIGTFALLIWGQSIGAMQLMQVVYGWATAAEVAYYAYIYAVIDERHYQKATSYVRCAVLAGRCVAYGLGQLLITTGIGDYRLLNYISLGSVCFILIFALVLPDPSQYDVKKALPLPSEGKPEERSPLHQKSPDFEPQNVQTGTWGYVKHYFCSLFGKFKRCYSDAFVIKWSLWWALATCGFFQVGNYIQNVWAEIQMQDQQSVYNGVTEAVSTLLGAVAAVSVQFIHLNWSVLGEWVLAILSAVDAVLLIIISQTSSLLASYILYVSYCALYQMLITIATYNVACKLEADSYGLVFGCNTFVALLIQTVLTVLVADAHGFALDISAQFVTYGCYHGVISIIFLAMAMVTLWKTGFHQCFKLMRVRQDAKTDLVLADVDTKVTPQADHVD